MHYEHFIMSGPAQAPERPVPSDPHDATPMFAYWMKDSWRRGCMPNNGSGTTGALL